MPCDRCKSSQGGHCILENGYQLPESDIANMSIDVYQTVFSPALILPWDWRSINYYCPLPPPPHILYFTHGKSFNGTLPPQPKGWPVSMNSEDYQAAVAAGQAAAAAEPRDTRFWTFVNLSVDDFVPPQPLASGTPALADQIPSIRHAFPKLGDRFVPPRPRGITAPDPVNQSVLTSRHPMSLFHSTEPAFSPRPYNDESLLSARP